MKTIIIMPLLVISLCCNNARSKDERISVNRKEVFIRQDSLTVGYNNLLFRGKLTKQIKVNKNSNYYKKCVNWRFEKKYLKNILNNMKLVSANEAYAKCYQYACWYQGEVGNGKLRSSITIYAGGEITLKNNSETLHFISTVKSKYFLDTCNCCE